MKQLQTPVALIVFKRPDTTRRVFEAVRAARPTRLFLIADGARPDRAGEEERCEEVRKIISAVDWACDVEIDFAKKNLGSRRRVISGLNWVFSKVEDAIILEDDCLPNASFFPYCTEMLERYRNHPQVANVIGFNPLEKKFSLPYSYYFSHVGCLWGWATWRRAWKEFDEFIRSWPEVKQAGILHLLFPNKRVVDYWSIVFDEMYHGVGPDAWDYQWVYTCWTQNWLSIIPNRNLIQNIGVGEGATHTTGADPIITIPAGSLSFPLKHPPAITVWPEHAMQMHRLLYTPGLGRRIRRKIARVRQQMQFSS